MKTKGCCLLCFVFMFFLSGCPMPDDPMPTSAYQPILMSRAQLENSIALKDARIISNPGKLYHYGDYILINELFEGVHIIDNKDPASPLTVGFIQVPGNVDFAVKDNIVYVDNAVDLVALDISTPGAVQVTKRIRNRFPALLPPDDLPYKEDWAGAPKDAVIVGWEPLNTK